MPDQDEMIAALMRPNPGGLPPPLQIDPARQLLETPGAGAVAALTAGHMAELPKQMFESSENLRQGGDYNPAPFVETALSLAGGGMPAAEKGALGSSGGWFPKATEEWGPVAARLAASVGKEGDVPATTFKSLKDSLAWQQAYKAAAIPKKGPVGNVLKHFPPRQAENTVGESSPWKPAGINSYGHEYFPESIKTEGVPEHLPTPIPERATAAGFNVPLAHGTKEDPFTEFKLPYELERFGRSSAEIGVHAGSPKAANKFGGSYLSNYGNNRIYPLVMRAQNPLESPDLGNWGPRNIAEFLGNHPEFGNVEVSKALKGEYPAEIRDEGAVEQIKALRDLIQSKGYDSIKYKNTVEDPGHTSYIALDPKQLRSPWAAFKDLDSRNLLAGLAGGVVAAPALTPQIRDTVKALNK
jgi:hypothetical protein